jgi:hypothetical protein
MDYLHTTMGAITCDMRYTGKDPVGIWMFEDLACVRGTVVVFAIYNIKGKQILVKWRLFMIVLPIPCGYQLLKNCLDYKEFDHRLN